MFGFSFGELLVIALVAILVLGPEDLPKAVRTASRAWRSFQLTMRDLRSQIDQAIGQEELAELRQLRESLKGKTGFIRDINGHWRETFDVEGLMRVKNDTRQEVSGLRSDPLSERGLGEGPFSSDASPPLVEADGTPLKVPSHE